MGGTSTFQIEKYGEIRYTNIKKHKTLQNKISERRNRHDHRGTEK